MQDIILNWVAQTPLALAVTDQSWLFPTFETLHFLGLICLVGSMILVDLRMIGFVRRGSGLATLPFTQIAAAGLALVALSGFGLFSSNPAGYWGNSLFKIKMGLVVLGLVNVVWFELRERKAMLALADNDAPPVSARWIGGASLGLWFAVIILGRFLPVLGGG